MSHSPVTLYSRIPYKEPFARKPDPKPTTAQFAIEWVLFAVFGLTLLIATLAAIFANSESHRRVPNHVTAGIAADRVNVLLVVAASERPRASAEALMLLSVKPSTGDVVVISIPSDLWVRLGRFGARRLGSAPAVGSTSGYPGRGPGLVSDTVAHVLGQPVHAFVRVTPTQVTRLVDAAGGVDVDVQRGAYDAKTRARFHRGRHHLNGAGAVRYALSRHMVGAANDRFAREARQRAVVAALLSKSTLETNVPGVVTNLAPRQFAWLAKTVAGRPARTITLAPYVDVFEVATMTDRGEALRPRVGDFEQLQQIAANVFSPAIPAQ